MNILNDLLQKTLIFEKTKKTCYHEAPFFFYHFPLFIVCGMWPKYRELDPFQGFQNGRPCNRKIGAAALERFNKRGMESSGKRLGLVVAGSLWEPNLVDFGS